MTQLLAPTIAAVGWNSWDVTSVSSLVHLPSSLRLRFGLLNLETGELTDRFNARTGVCRLGVHASDGSYLDLSLQLGTAVIALECAAEGSTLMCRVTPIQKDETVLLTLEVDGAWGKILKPRYAENTFYVEDNSQSWIITVPLSIQPPPLDLLDGHSIMAFNLDQQILVTAAAAENASRIQPDLLTKKRDAYLSVRLTSDGWLSSAAEGLLSAVQWNTIWEPMKGRICTPVTRVWCDERISWFGSYVLFEWDTFFCALMAAPADPALATANVRAILQEITPRGFVPNFGAAWGASNDRSMLPVGSYCLLKLYRSGSLSGRRNVYHELVLEAFPLLLRWHRWWLPNRDGNHDGLLEYGSDPIPTVDPRWQYHTFQAALFEACIDNGAEYEGAIFNTETHTLELIDVGLNSFYALDAWALSELASELSLDQVADELQVEYGQIKKLMNEILWNDEAGMYQNKHWDGHFSGHLAPQLFYPLIAGIASSEQAQRMVQVHLLNEEEFWGPYVIPASPRNSDAYAQQEYWRGRIWGPLNYLVGEGLRRYGYDAVMESLAQKSLDVFRAEWENEGHIHENYNANTGDGDDHPWSDPFYHFGALLAYTALQEMADAEVWHGWRFGNLKPQEASFRQIRLDEGLMDIQTQARGLQVTLNGQVLLLIDRPVIVRGFRQLSESLQFSISAETTGGLARLIVGCLPVGHLVTVITNNRSQQARTSDQGQIELSTTLPNMIQIHWS